MIARFAAIAAVGLATTLAAIASPAAAETHALLIGVNTYLNIHPGLLGSVNDADDLTAVLRKDGLKDVTELTDEKANRANFTAAWNAMVGNAHPGDLLVLSFSGHGTKADAGDGVPAPNDGSRDGFLLNPWDPADTTAEMLSEHELYDLFKLATDKGLKILFIADACHAGLGVRGVNDANKPANPAVRFIQTPKGKPKVTPQPVPPPPDDTARPANPSVTVFAATQDNLLIEEITAQDGRRHGALSYTVARGLEGAAADKDGTVTVAALYNYAVPLINDYTNNTQWPNFTMPDGRLEVISHHPDQPDQPVAIGPLTSKNLAVRGDGATPNLAGALLVAQETDADLVWDRAKGVLLDHQQDPIISGVTSDAALQAAVTAAQVRSGLQAIATAQQGSVAVSATSPGIAAGGYFPEGTPVTFALDPGDAGYVTLVDLNANGSLNLMWPIPTDPQIWSGGAFSMPIKVTPPFGADFIVAITSRKPVTDLRTQVADFNRKGTAAAAAFYEALRKARDADPSLRIGLTSVFTCHSIASNGQCLLDSSSP